MKTIEMEPNAIDACPDTAQLHLSSGGEIIAIEINGEEESEFYGIPVRGYRESINLFKWEHYTPEGNHTWDCGLCDMPSKEKFIIYSPDYQHKFEIEVNFIVAYDNSSEVIMAY
jgi:hypothetical protein